MLFSPVPTNRTLSPELSRPSKDGRRFQPVRFTGVGDAISSVISVIDSSRTTELIMSDGLGMVVPRVGVAVSCRGTDDGRETLIRETAGLFCVALLAGLSNRFMVAALGNRVSFFNPHGIPAKAWISAKSLEVFSRIYEDALKQANSPEELRGRFIQRILQGMESSDGHFSIEGRLATLKNFAHKLSNEESARKLLDQMLKERYGDSLTPERRKSMHSRLRDRDWDGLRKQFLQRGGWGRLSPEGEKELLEWFRQKKPDDSTLKGLMPLDALARDRVGELGHVLSLKDEKRQFLTTRLRLSLAELQEREPAFLKAVNQLALEHGLTSEIHLKDVRSPGEAALISGQSRSILLKELKYFLEHYVDRAAFSVGTLSQEPGKVSLLWSEQQQLLHQTMFAAPVKGVRKLFPHSEDGLVTSMMKAKSVYTWLPLVVTIFANGAFTFLNNYLTRRKYHGKVFFPGEEASLPNSALNAGKESVS